MFMPAPNDFGFMVDNFGATYSDVGIGTGLTSGAANVAGTTASLLAGASVTEDIYGIAICFSGGNVSATVKQFLCNFFLDSAGGTSWATAAIIPNLMSNSPCLLNGGYWYYFPIFIKSGSSIGANARCSTASSTIRVAIQLFGRPKRPELCKVGAYVRDFGTATAGSNGTSITPGTSAMSAYVSLGTTADDLWYWQGGLASNDTTLTAVGYLLDVAVGDASNKRIANKGIAIGCNNTAEQWGKSVGAGPFFCEAPSGSIVYAKAACIGTPDSLISAAAYGVGG